ncbi:putative helicase [Frigoribacterium sp. 9N]|nr:putative helicase [Frigoribacterium sp. 9N]
MTALQDTVYDSKKYQDIIRAIRRQTLQLEFPMINVTDALAEIDWNFALLCASALSTTPGERSQKAVLRIATACLALPGSDTSHKEAAAALLERAGNLRAVELAERRGLIHEDSWRTLPPLLRLESIRTQLRLSIPLSSGEDLSVNSFQESLWSDVDQYDWVSVSAPTSAGKSRVIREWFLEQLRARSKLTAVYLAPTRALVEEVSADFRQTVPGGTRVVVMPWDPDLESSTSRVLVLTQERLHLIQQARSPFPIDLLFVDEAQGLGSGDRGILLRQVIDRAVIDHPALQVIFASPLSANPELLLTGKPDDSRGRAVTSEAVTVNQNLVRVEGVPRAPAKRTVSLIHEGQPTKVAEFELNQRATKVAMRLAYVAHALGGDRGGNIVYVNGASDAEKVAQNIVDLLPVAEPDPDIENLKDLIRTAVHQKYSLADVLDKRVAFHYGNMPLAIRAEIKRLFGQGKIHYLVCTSTLLEGVNLPCRSIFMRNPQKGRGKALSEGDFWNLAGRAGRWGREFQGNIVCIDTDDEKLWPNLPSVRGRSQLKLATEHVLANPSDFLSYLRGNSPISGSGGSSENLFSYLSNISATGMDLEGHLRFVQDPHERDEVEHAIERAIARIEYPVELISRHAGISPLSMQRLLEQFRAASSDPNELALPLPEEDESRDRFQDALRLLGATITQAFGGAVGPGENDKRKWQLANLIVNWMNGLPLARLIEQRVNNRVPLAKAIRDVMADVETVARFQAPKYLTCYSDILSAYGRELGIEQVGHGQDITMLLELGVSRPSEVILMSLGMSRMATVALSDYLTVDDWTPDEGLRWLADLNFEGLDIPVLIQREIAQLLVAYDERLSLPKEPA